MKKIIIMAFLLCLCLFFCAFTVTSDPFHTHNYGQWTISKAATCTEDGEEKRTCECGAFETKSIEKVAHTEVIDKEVAATCTETGLTEGKHCSVCNTVIVKQETVKAKGHTEVVDKAVTPTCTKTGLTEGKHCSACDEIIVAQQTVAKTQHQATTLTGQKPTATVSGSTDGSKCSVCGTTITKQTSLISLKEYVQSNPTQISGGEYTLFLNANELDSSFSNDYVLQIKASGTTVTVALTKGSTYILSITLNSTNSTNLEYAFGNYINVLGTQYYDAMRGYFPVSSLYNLEKLDYSESSSTIGNREPAKTERFDGHKVTACNMAKQAITLLDKFLEMYDFGYGVEVYGFNPY